MQYCGLTEEATLSDETVFLKGQCHEIFCFWFFACIGFPPASVYPIRTVSNFFRTFAKIFASQGVPPVSTIPAANLPPVSTLTVFGMGYPPSPLSHHNWIFWEATDLIFQNQTFRTEATANGMGLFASKKEKSALYHRRVPTDAKFIDQMLGCALSSCINFTLRIIYWRKKPTQAIIRTVFISKRKMIVKSVSSSISSWRLLHIIMLLSCTYIVTNKTLLISGDYFHPACYDRSTLSYLYSIVFDFWHTFLIWHWRPSLSNLTLTTLTF